VDQGLLFYTKISKGVFLPWSSLNNMLGRFQFFILFSLFSLYFLKWNTSPIKKLILSALKKAAIHGVKWHFSALKASITATQPCTAQLPTFSAMATALHGVALKNRQYTV
jgi:hypothetical protein